MMKAVFLLLATLWSGACGAVLVVNENNNNSNKNPLAFPNKQAWKAIVLGVFEGVFGEAEQQLSKCVMDGVVALDDLEQAIEDIRQDTPESVKEGVKLIGEAMQVAADDLRECQEVIEDIDELENLAVLLTHPWSFVYHVGKNLIINHVEILDQVQAAVAAWESDPKEYYQFGLNVGKALEEIAAGETEAGDMLSTTA